MMLICCPLGRPGNVERVLRLWRQQTVPSRLLLAGRNDGTWTRIASRANADVLVNYRTVGAARNAGISHALGWSLGWVVQWDDDNYYGPRYLERIASAIEPGVDVVSMGLGFVRAGSQLWHFPRPVGFFPGHSTAVRAAVAPNFPEVSRGEDVEWSRRLAPAPERVRWLEPWGLVYDRTGDGHAYDADSAEFLRSFGPAVPLGHQPDSFVDEPRELPTGPLVRAKDEAVFRSLERRFERQGVSP